MSRKVAKNNESGVALLFALGILSLLLVLGLAFASNALLAQKVAHNNSSRSQAKQFALSAVNRIAISIMYLQSKLPSSAILEDYSDVYSSGMDGKDENNKTYADGLFSKEDSLLTPPASASPDKPDDSTYQKPKWTFIFDKPKGVTGRKIIGRIAYQQVVSSKGLSKITLDSVLRGVYAQSSHASGTPAVNHEPWNTRWGKTISELNLNKTTPLDDWYHKALDETDLKEDSYSSISSFFLAYKNEYFNDANADKKKAFIERWFTDGTEPVEPEFYRYKISAGTTSEEFKLYHRFNLGDLTDCYLEDDIWYDRFRNDTSITLNKNSADILDKLAHDGVEFKTTDELTPADTGIPFLKQIANERGTFSTLEARRKQIAANLNDYCDSDSKPTSDVDATNWSVDEDKEEPTFTGNERTPYIYELGYKLEIYHQADGATKTKGFEVDVTNKKLGFQLALFPAVKLAQIYENVPDDFQKFIFKNSVKEISLKGKIIEATYNGIKYKYKNAEGNEVEASSPASGTIEVADKEITFEPKWNITPSTGTGELLLNKPNDADNNISFDLPLNGYPFGEAKDSNNWHGEKYQTDVPGLFDEKILKQVVKSTTPHDPTTIVSGPTSVEITKVNVSEVTVKRGALLLQGQLKDTSSPFGVDFVRAPQKEENSLKFNPTGSALSLSEAEAFTFLLGGIQGMDPRQNLNEDDWHVSARATAGTSQWDAVMDVSTGTPVTGKANVSHGPELDPPFDPGMATDTSKYDQEKKVANNGPAWGDDTNHLSTAYIRNAPMQSLWELGVIHRGAAWQTLNLKAAGAPGGTGSISLSDMKQGLSWDNPSGTSYANGDGGILEQVKLTEKAYSYGLININMFCSDPNINENYQSDYDDQMGQALFYNILYGQQISTFETETQGTISIGMDTTITDALKSACYIDETSQKKPFASRTQFLDWKYKSDENKRLFTAFGALPSITSSSDAQQEEIVGKTINLLKAEPSASNVIQFIVVAQTIRDLNGMVTRVRPDDNTVITKNCAYGQFDVARYIDKDDSKLTITSDASGKLSNDGSDPSTPDSTQSPDDFIYFDEITGEVKMLVTLEKVSEVTGQLIVTSIEYID